MPDNYEVSIVRKNGEVRHLQVMRKGILWGGKPHYQTIYQDVTEQKQAAEALKLSEERWKTTVDHAPVGIATTNPERRFVTANGTFCRILGYTESELKKLTFKDITHPEDVAESITLMQALDDGKVPLFHQEKRYIKKDGTVIYGKVGVNVLHDNAGKVRMYIAELEDITERKQAEEALRTSEEKYRLIVEKSNDVIYTFNPQGEFTYISPSVKNMLGYNPSDLIGRTFSSLLHPDDVQRLRQVVQLNIKDGTQTPGGNEYRVRSAAGEWRWQNSSGNAVFDAQGRYINFVGVTRDITERKLMAMRLDELHRTLQLVTDINQLIVKIDNEAELLQQACNEFVKSKQYPLAWIGFKEEGSYDILPSVMCGERADYLSKIKITWDDSRFGQGPTGTAIRTGKFDVERDMAPDPRYAPWRNEALKSGFKTSVAFPLVIQDEVVGALTIYSASAEAFNKDELDLLEELAGDLSLGIEKIRRRETQIKLEEALRLSEQNFRNSMENSIMGIRIVDAEWHTLYANHIFMDMFGYKNINEIGRYSLHDRYAPEEKARYRQRMEKRQRGELIPDNPKVDIIGKDGNILSIVIYSSEVLWDGKPQRQLIYYDITERQKAEDALKLSEQNFRNSLDSSLIGIRIVDRAGDNLYLNQTFLNFFGYENAAEVEASPPQEHYTPECHAEYLRRGERIAQGEPLPDEYEIDIIRKDGGIRHLQLFRREVLWNGKKEWQVLYNDITERVRAEAALKASEQNFRNSMNSSTMGIRIMGDADSTVYVNQALLDIFGYENIDELRTSPPQEHYTPESHAAFDRRHQKFISGETLPEKLEFDIIRKDGAVRHLQISSKQVLWNGKQQFQLLYNDITERVQAETALKLSEQNFRNSLENSLMGIYISDAEWHVLYVNRAFLNMFGYENIEEVRKSLPHEHLTPAEYQKFLRRQEKSSRGEPVPDNLEMDVLHKDGTTRHLQVFRNDVLWDGQPQRQLIYNDLTERVRTEEALKQSEENFRNSIESSILGIRITDANRKTLYANQAFLNIFGYRSIDEVSLLPLLSHATPEEKALYLIREEKRSRGEIIPDKPEVDIRRNDGSVRHLQVFRDDVYWNGKKVTQIVYHDVTKRAQAEEALQRSEENFRNTLDTSLMGIFIGDSGNVLYVNRAFLEMFGYDNLDEVRAKRPVEFYAPESYVSYLQRRERQQRGEPNPDNFEIDVVHKDGAVRHLQVFRKEVLWNGKLQSQLLYNDITALKQAEEERRKLEDRAQVASRLAVVGEMAAGVAHEINNPLTGVLGFSQMMLEKESVPEEIKAELRLIVDGSQRVADIVKRLLTFARQTKPVKTMTNINELLDNNLKLREYVLKTANINVVTRFDPELPWSVADPGQLQQVFLNLIVNAEQAMKGAHDRGTLTVTTEKKGNNIIISFQDDGPGITPENRKRLFEPFFTTKAPGEGTGLGLSLSRSIILEHNGKMYVESEFGHGATFIIELPIVESLPAETDAQLAPVKAQPADSKHGKILVVDDEPGVRILLERVFTQMGHTVDTVADAETAIEKLNAGTTYDVMLTDVRMPGVSGIELHSYVLAKTPAMKNRIVFITGDVMGIDIKEFLMKNNLPSFSKPFDIEALKEKINNMIVAGPPENCSADGSGR